MGDTVTNLKSRRESRSEQSALPDPEPTTPIGLSDDDLASRFSEEHGPLVRYVPSWDRWFIWNGVRFVFDTKRLIFDLIRTLCRVVLAEHLTDTQYTDSQRKALRQRLGSAGTVWAVAKLVGSDPRHAISPNELDSDPWSLNTPGGIVDLTTGQTRPHDPVELHSKITSAAPIGECPLFLATLERAQPDPEVRAYLQRFCGYALTGSAKEHVLEFWHGGGRNLKGTLAHAVRRALGDYGLEIAAETLMETKNERHPTELAALYGARLVIGSEVDSGRRWNESRVKRLTGGDPISARYMGKDFFEFEPSHSLLAIANTKPALSAIDEAMRSRMHLVEFSVTIPETERDTSMPDRLRAEEGGILAWALAGCLEWQKIGLAPPRAVREATADYLAGEDMLQAWITEKCQLQGQLTLAAAHRSYREWAELNGAVVLGRNTFGDHLAQRGFARGKDRNKSPVFSGISLASSMNPREDRE